MSPGPVVVPDRKITRDDIESKLHEIQGEVSATGRGGQDPGDRDRGRVVVLTIAAAYFLGRRKGKRRQTVLEIRRSDVRINSYAARRFDGLRRSRDPAHASGWSLRRPRAASGWFAIWPARRRVFTGRG